MKITAQIKVYCAFKVYRLIMYLKLQSPAGYLPLIFFLIRVLVLILVLIMIMIMVQV